MKRSTFRIVRVLEAFMVALVFLLFMLFILGAYNGAQASEPHYFALLGSHHTDGEEYCEFNPGIGMSFANTLGNTTSIMAYKNSQCTLSLLASASAPIGDSAFHWSLGAAIGYDYAPFVPFVSIQYQHEHFFIGAAPIDDGLVFYYGVKL